MKNTWLLRLSIVINFLLIIPVNNAQNSSMSFLDDVMEDISVNNDEEEELNWENVIEELSERIQQPVNLNSATKEQLEQFPFLNDIQIENLLAYVYINGQMQTIYELQLVEEMDWETIHYLLPFVCVQPVHKREAYPSLKSIFKYGKHELLTRMDIPFYTRKGYEQTYLGPPIYHSLRYGFRYKEHIYAGMTGEVFDLFDLSSLDGLVIEALGAGNLPPTAAQKLMNIIKLGIPVVLVSRCFNGIAEPVYAYEGGGSKLAEAGVMFAPEVNSQKARIKLLIGLNGGLEGHALKKFVEN